MTGLHNNIQKSSEKIDTFFHGSRCVHKARNFSSGGSSMFFPDQFLEEALSSQNGEPRNKKRCAPLSYTSYLRYASILRPSDSRRVDQSEHVLHDFFLLV